MMLFFCVYLFEDLDLHRLFGHHAFESRVLVFQGPQAPRLLYLHPSVLVLPLVLRPLADVVPRTDRLYRLRLRFLQYPDDLLFTEPTSLHFVLPFILGAELYFCHVQFSGVRSMSTGPDLCRVAKEHTPGRKSSLRDRTYVCRE
jgi:hypothetical protein